jgi:hypothetical protein
VEISRQSSHVPFSVKKAHCQDRLAPFSWRGGTISGATGFPVGSKQSDTPRRAGGLMSWAASKAVGYGSRRRALRAYFLASEAPVIAIRGLLLADVLASLFQLKTNCGHRVTVVPRNAP